MQLEFIKTPGRCLMPAPWDTQSVEQVLEIRLPENAPGAERVVGVWGQPLMRAKQWGGGRVEATGGVACWVLYVPEDGAAPRWAEGWMPFELGWDLPGGGPDGTAILSCSLRSLDARLTGAGKLLVRGVITAGGQGLIPGEYDLYTPGDLPEDVQLRRQTHCLRIPVEAGEKSLTLDEDLTLPEGLGAVEEVFALRAYPQVEETKLLGDKLVFRGQARVCMLCRCAGGRLVSHSCQVPLSQYMALEGTYGPEAQARVVPLLTQLEGQLLEDGRLRLRGDMSGQYTVCEDREVSLVTDAYSTARTLELTLRRPEIPAWGPWEALPLAVEKSLPGGPGKPVDATVLGGQPRMKGGSAQAEGMAQALWYGEDGDLWGAWGTWEASAETAPDAQGALWPRETAQAQVGDGQVAVRGDFTLEVRGPGPVLPEAVTAITLGEPLGGQRPSLILRRAGQGSLWDIAKATASTVEAIAAANGLEGEPEPDAMLLIPMK